MMQFSRIVMAWILVCGFAFSVKSAELHVPGGYPTIQAAMDAAVTGDIITVANGTYSGEGNRDLDFDGKAITVRSAKGPQKCIINCGGTESEPHRGFIFESGEDENSIVDGFTITNGYRSGGVLAGSGGAIYCSGASPTIRNCIITGNVAGGDDTAGGGIVCRDQSYAVIENCTIKNNQAGEHGGGIRCSESNVTIRNCLISDNAGTRDNSWGGGISIFSCRPEISNCVISNNSAQKDGGGIYGQQGAGPIVTQCILQNNVAGQDGGGACFRWHPGVSFINCVVSNNFCQSSGGGLYFYDCDPNVIACSIEDNIAVTSEGGISANECPMTTIRDSQIISNTAQQSSVGGIYVGYGSAVIEDVIIMNNTSVLLGGGFKFIDSSGAATLTMNRCKIIGNQSDDGGGGIYIGSSNAAAISNTLITGNVTPTHGGGIFVDSAQLAMQNCTIYGNRAVGYYGGGVSCWNDTILSMRNCIVWQNEAGNGDNIAIRGLFDPTVASIANSCIEGGQVGVDRSGDTTLVWDDSSNLPSDPNFVSPGYWDDNDTPGDPADDIWIIGEYHLLPGSACIDAGDPNNIDPNDVDLIGNDRFLGSQIDMGAYENEPVDITVSKMTVKAGKTREQQADSFNISGTFAAWAESFAAADTVSLRVGAWSETLRTADFQQAGKGIKFTYKGPTGGITAMSLDFIKGIFTASGKELSLTGTTAPVSVALVMGDYYGFAVAEDTGDDDVINGKKTLPIQLLSGHTDTLQVTKKIKVKPGAENNVASLIVQGTFTSREMADVAATGLTIHWGTDSYTIETQYITEKSEDKFVAKKKSFAADLTSVNVTIDFVKCTFKIVLKNTKLPWQESSVIFGLEFGSFYQQEEISLDE